MNRKLDNKRATTRLVLNLWTAMHKQQTIVDSINYRLHIPVLPSIAETDPFDDNHLRQEYVEHMDRNKYKDQGVDEVDDDDDDDYNYDGIHKTTISIDGKNPTATITTTTTTTTTSATSSTSLTTITPMSDDNGDNDAEPVNVNSTLKILGPVTTILNAATITDTCFDTVAPVENTSHSTDGIKIPIMGTNAKSFASAAHSDIDGLNKYRINRRIKLTPYQMRLKIASIVKSCGETDNILEIAYNLHLVQRIEVCDKASSERQKLLEHTVKTLYNDVINVLNYRKTCDPINKKTFKKWFPGQPMTILYEAIDENRDFIYNSHGLRLLKNRYLRPNEPIQYAMVRIAKLFIGNKQEQQQQQQSPNDYIHGIIANEYFDENDPIEDYEWMVHNRVESHYDNSYWIIYYHMISCGFMQVSSILADADNADETIIRGEACRLVVATKDYGRKFIKQIESVCSMISLGVGVGMSVATVPLNGINRNGHIHGGIVSLIRKLDACNHLSIYERKPKIALYLTMHNDSIYEVFDARNPAKEHVGNVFFGVLISDYFMDCLRNKSAWYLFPGNVTLDGEYLSDFHGDEFAAKYQKFVAAKLYTTKTTAVDLMDKLLASLCQTGSPYVIWGDNLDKYNNQSHMGKIQTLNLCAEITNYASYEQSSSCTLLSMNFGMFRDFEYISEAIYEYLAETDDAFNECLPRDRYREETRFAYMLGYMGTRALNDFMGPDRKLREIGINPMGVYDMATMNDRSPLDIVGVVSEAMYMGAIHSSCAYSQEYGVTCERYANSHFSHGRPQWMLRKESPHLKWPKYTFNMMRSGMANSMLTSQAPTATTSMLCGVTESVMLPLSIITIKESENGRNAVISYGMMYNILNKSSYSLVLQNDIDSQVAMYEKSAPYIDQSQSTMFSLELTKQNVFNLLKSTYYAKLKTAIYYILPKSLNPTLEIIRSTTSKHKYYEEKMKYDGNDGNDDDDDTNKEIQHQKTRHVDTNSTSCDIFKLQTCESCAL